MAKKPVAQESAAGAPDPRDPKARATREETTERILDAAEELFASRSPRDVTVRDVAQKAGVSHALVHQYVGSKADLLGAVIQRVTGDRAALVKRSASLTDALRRLSMDIMDNRAHSTIMARSAMDGIEYVPFQERIPTAQALIDLVGESAAKGTQPEPPPRDVDPRVVLAGVSALAVGWAAFEDWLVPLFGLEGRDKSEVRRQVSELSAYLGSLLLLGEAPPPTG